jgi:predicted TIM-barrel fold metal-dependent hydrolase
MISADTHVVEPADLWVSRLPERLRGRAPHIESRPDGDHKVTEGSPERRISGAEGGMAITKGAGETITAERQYRYADQRPGAWDPKARIADQDRDGIAAEVVYPGWLQLFNMPDHELRVACMRVYNDWLAEFCAAVPGRLVGAAQLPLAKGAMDLAIAEARRAREIGLGTVMLPQIADLAYDQPEYEPLWAALEELGLPVSIHISTGGASPAFKGAAYGTSTNSINTTRSKTGVGSAAIELIWGGVPQRYPKLKFVMTEGGIGWIAFTMRFMDHWWEDHRYRLQPRLEESPGFYFKRNFWATFEDDRPGILTLPLLNEDHLMWSNDYPHTEGTWPNSVRQIEKDLGDLSEATRRKLICDNAAALYSLG